MGHTSSHFGREELVAILSVNFLVFNFVLQ